MNTILTALSGANVFGYFVIALCFLKFWKRTRDSLFFVFSTSFLILGLGTIAEMIVRDARASTPTVYLCRFVAFSFIIYAIIRKNMPGRPS